MDHSRTAMDLEHFITTKYSDTLKQRIVRLNFPILKYSRYCEINLLSQVSEFYSLFYCNRHKLPVCSYHKTIHSTFMFCCPYPVSKRTVDLIFDLILHRQTILDWDSNNLVEFVKFCGFLLCDKTFLSTIFLVSLQYSNFPDVVTNTPQKILPVIYHLFQSGYHNTASYVSNTADRLGYAVRFSDLNPKISYRNFKSLTRSRQRLSQNPKPQFFQKKI